MKLLGQGNYLEILAKNLETVGLGKLPILIMAKPKGPKARRTYDLTKTATDLLDALSDLGYIKEHVVEAGITLFALAPADLKDAALSGSGPRVKDWYSLAFDAWAVSVVEKMRRDSATPSKGKSAQQG